ncbi:MAG: acyl-CoA dehydrogenase family protein [Gaiellaceae bacterium]
MSTTASDPVATAKSFSARLAEDASGRDRERRFPHAEIDEMRKTGLFALRVPAEHGGGGGSIADYVRVVEALAKGDPNVAQMYITHTYGVELLNQVDADPTVRGELYRRLAEDGLFIGNDYSERGTKTIFDFKTELAPDPDGGWRLNGTKFYATGSGGGDVLYVSGKIEPPASDTGHTTRDLGEVRMVFLERDTPGMTIHDDWDGMGQRTTSSGTVELNDVHVADELCFRTEGFDQPESLFSIVGQAGFAAVYVGIAEAALEAGLEYVRDRARPWPHAEVDAATEDPYVVSHAGRMSTELSTAKAMLASACDAIDAAEKTPSGDLRALASVKTSEAKAVATEVSLSVSERVFQICGAGATVAKYNMDRFWRDARTLTLHDPVDYKYKLVGEWALNGESPPVTSFT